MTEQKPYVRRINVLLSIIISFSAWMFVVYNYNPVKTVTYKDVPIKFIGEDVLASRGYTVSKSSKESIDVVMNVQRTHFNRITPEDITIHADVSNAVEGGNGISLSITPPDDATLIRASSESISVEVGACTTKTVDLAVAYPDDAEGEPVPSYMAENKVTVYATENLINKVKCAKLVMPKKTEAKQETHTVAPVAIDENGEVVGHVVVTPGEVTARVDDGMTKTVLVDLDVKDDSKLKKDYSTVSRVMIKGYTKAIGGINRVTTKKIDLTGITEDTEIPLEFNLPDGVYLSYKSTGEVLSVTIPEKK